jgi:hypothetical protein
MNQKKNNTEDFSRRNFLKQIGLLGLATGMPAVLWKCSSKSTGYNGTGIAPYSVWEEMLMALESSPDHLEGRMNLLIKEGNPQAMFNFVKDEIYLMPTSGNSLRGLGKTMRYGIRGALRTGFATPREKAELLHSMFTKANITSSVIYERTDIQPEEVPSFFYRPVERKFEPVIDKKILNRWSNVMGAEESKSEATNPDPDLTESKKLAEKLWEMIPEKDKIRPQSFDFRWDNYRTPTVEFKWEGETKYAHLFDPKIPFGSLRNESSGSTSAAEAPEYLNEKISISLSCRDGINPQDEKELVQGEWPAYELAGNQVVLSFLHGLNIEKQITTPVGNLRIFTPALSFQSFDADRNFMEARSFLGNPVTLEGKIINISDEKASIGNSTLLAKSDANLQKQIQQIKVKAIPGSYPQVKLHVSPINANGEIIEGLSAADFAISDNVIPVQAILESNQRTPRVLILYDTSLSMPKNYFGENMDAFVASLESAILGKFPDTQITKWETNSDLYTWLSKASHTSNDLIIFATDGDNGDDYDAAKMEKLKFGPPALVLNVNNSSTPQHIESFNNMANVTNGMVLDAKDQQKTIENITRYFEKLEIPPYVFTYRATDKEANHQVQITADNQRVKANVEYSFSLIPDDETVAGEQIIGLYLNVKVGNHNVRRVLSGWDNIVDRDRKPTFKNFTDVQNMFLGNILISVEGEGPTLSAALSDILKYRLSTRKWGEAVIQNEIEKAVEAFQEGGFMYDENLASLMQPLQNAVTADSLTFAAGPRISIVKTWPGINREFSKYSFDFLPTSNYTTLSNNPLEGFKTTLNKTAQLAILENNFFDTNTLSVLAPKNIISSQEANNTDWFRQLYREGPDARFWYEKISRGDGSFKFFDQSATEKAFWRIDERTGELYGLLPDMTGGGTNHIQAQLDELSRVMNAYSLYFSAMGVASLPIGIATVYGLMLVRLYAIVCEALIVMDTTGMNEKIIAAMQQFACNVKKEIMLATLGPVGTAISGLDNLIGLMGGGGIPGMQC